MVASEEFKEMYTKLPREWNVVYSHRFDTEKAHDIIHEFFVNGVTALVAAELAKTRR